MNNFLAFSQLKIVHRLMKETIDANGKKEEKRMFFIN